MHAERQIKLFLFAERLRVEAEFAQRPGEIGGETVQRENFFRRDALYELDQARKISVFAQWKCGIGAGAEAATGIHRPAGDYGSARLAELLEQDGARGLWRGDENFVGGIFAVKDFVGWKLLAEVFIDARQLGGVLVQRDGQAGFTQASEEFLALAE